MHTWNKVSWKPELHLISNNKTNFWQWLWISTYLLCSGNYSRGIPEAPLPLWMMFIQCNIFLFSFFFNSLVVIFFLQIPHRRPAMPLKIFLIIWLKRNNQKAPKQANKIHKSQKCLQKAMLLIIYPVSLLAGLLGIPPVSSYALLTGWKDFESGCTQEALVHQRV